jgi:hypothetical protein
MPIQAARVGMEMRTGIQPVTGLLQVRETANPRPAAGRAGIGIWPGRPISSIKSRTSPGGRPACWLLEETDFYGSQVLIQKLPTIVTAAIPTAVAPAPTAVVTARRRRRRSADLTAAAAPTGVTQAGISSRRSRDISPHGESEDRRDFRLRRLARVWTRCGPLPKADATSRVGVVAYGSKARFQRCADHRSRSRAKRRAR